MGLDMYAYRKLYVKQWDHQRPEERYSVKVKKGGQPVPGLQANRISRVEEEVMYWRKANHIHAWFVDNVQDGSDDCGTYYVDIEKLRDLLTRCEKVIKASKLVEGHVNNGTVFNKEHPTGMTMWEPGKVIADDTVAKAMLPRREGFFFGGEEYDEYYLEDVVETRDWAVQMLADHDAGVPGDIYYHSSW